MRRNDQCLVRCVFARAAFPHERVFWIEAPSGGYYRGLAYIAYCISDDAKTRLPDEEPPPGARVSGFIVARLIQSQTATSDIITVEVPGGETCDIRASQLIEGSADVPVGS